VNALAAFRDRVATVLAPGADDDWTVAANVVDSFTPPGYLLVWSDPWLLPSTFCAHLARLDVVCVSYRVDPDPGIARLEDLVAHAVAALSAAGLPESTVSVPARFDIGGVPYLASRVSVDARLAISDPATPAPEWDPFTLPWSGAYWAEDPAWTHPGDGLLVTNWRDGGSAAAPLAQANAAQRPTYRASVPGLNDKPGVRFVAASNQFLITSAAVGGPQPNSVVIVATLDAAAGGVNAVMVLAGDVYVFVQSSTTQICGFSYGPGPFGPPAAGTGIKAVRFLNNGPASAVTVNGVAALSAAGSGTFTATRVVGNDASGQPVDMTAAFIGLYAGDVTADPEWPAFQAWALAHYGVSIT
jgi:hypothetical protein